MGGQPLPRSHDHFDALQNRRVLADLEQRIARIETVINTGWTAPTNLTIERSLDANGTLAHIGDVLGTLIKDLKDRGRLSG